ncbi:MAG: bifunctional (p)ppGpp synthetase/guanosine-3',5'-bis(diphosphate) 3'-pyrophosphohydrolase [Clostridiales Family XIII bacterium]|jgi:GTP pyrophosphokinase|nr:bifunctional (p)ppGpp synthetase/guanosine-3',5'-bis(diphosphate) 3'-pyrophosphohydrolase [Clostridiales Family XIII bacterium]
MTGPNKSDYIHELLEINDEINISLIEKAYDTAARMHEGQLRKSGEEYIIHPLEVTKIIASLGMDTDTLIAGLLHDAVEDTPYTTKELEKDFGKDVLHLVDGVTKLDAIEFSTKDALQAENIRKMFLAMSKDIRVLIIKLSDRLHNLRTINYMNAYQIEFKCRETLEIYAPLAGRLGISKVKVELEDIALKYLEPNIYDDLSEKVNMKKSERDNNIKKIIRNLEKNIKELGIKADITGRSKHFYSIYKKLKKQSKDFDDIFDMMAVRVIVDTQRQCYEVLGLVHTLWKPVPGRFKDYISMPKPNMYQSIHTTVISDLGFPFEIQIRTKEMHKVAEYGIAAHWKYKEGIKDSGEDIKLAWIKEALELDQSSKDSEEFVEALKTDLFSNQIFIFTPNGKVIELPAGSTPIDFAFKIHTDIGINLIGAKVNENMVPIDYELSNGEIIEIITSKNASGPSLDWLKITKSNHAKSKIKNYLRKRGKLDDGLGKTKAKTDEIKNEKLLTTRHDKKLKEEKLIPSKIKSKSDFVKKRGDINIKGAEGLYIRLAKCCNPIPGDDIIGYITKGRGITVHRKNCENIKNLAGEDKQRLIEAEWNSIKREQNYSTALTIFAVDRRGIIADLSRVTIDIDTEILSLNMNKAKNERLTINLIVKITELNRIDRLIARIKQIVGVLDVERANA